VNAGRERRDSQSQIDTKLCELNKDPANTAEKNIACLAVNFFGSPTFAHDPLVYFLFSLKAKKKVFSKK
jgi:hypothetical protein